MLKPTAWFRNWDNCRAFVADVEARTGIRVHEAVKCEPSSGPGVRHDCGWVILLTQQPLDHDMMVALIEEHGGEYEVADDEQWAEAFDDE